ncbi:phasin family protein [Motiliproteus coralliicola]|uniref:Phasin family protein n=1 Tax=Motiliproteus coralliicola TaxID=2283196 RepID=A0A369WPH1_9GAMM|nr:phasin family protein [Motiliproteus coralliicola]RDE22514.1 phasin family protein [Motiliproteus coralliicola]
MYEKVLEDMKARMQPVLDLAETNKKAMETLASVQKESMTDVVNASLEQFKAVAECKEPQAALDLQVKFYKDLEAKMTESAEKSIAAISEAKEAYVSAVEEAAKKATAEFETAVQQATGK